MNTTDKLAEALRNLKIAAGRNPMAQQNSVELIAALMASDTALAAYEAEKGQPQVPEGMLDRGFVTGHGDSIDDLHEELGGQLGELRAEAVREAIRSCATNDSEGIELCYVDVLEDHAAKIERGEG